MVDDHPTTSEFVWTIKNVSKLTARNYLYSETFTVLGDNWRMLVFPKGNDVDDLSLYLEVADFATLSPGWSVHRSLKFVLLDQINDLRSIRKGTQHLFTIEEGDWGFESFLPLNQLFDLRNGYLVNDTLVVKVEITDADSHPTPLTDADSHPTPLTDADSHPTPLTDAVQVEGSAELTSTEVVYLSNLPHTKDETGNVNGFRMPALKAYAVERIFEKHPDFASNFHFKNHQVRSAFMNGVLAVIEKFCQSPVDFSTDDLCYCCTTLTDLEKAGFQVDWLDTKLEVVLRRKRQAALSETDELIKQDEVMKQMIVKENAETEAALACLSFSDII